MQDVAWVIEFREAIRTLASGNSGEPPPPAAAEVIDRTARAVSLRLRFPKGQTATLDAVGSGLEQAVATVLVAMYAAMGDGTWSRIKICRNPECRWAFYDRSRNRSGIWCEMAACGNRMKARRFRQRRRETQTERNDRLA